MADFFEIANHEGGPFPQVRLVARYIRGSRKPSIISKRTRSDACRDAVADIHAVATPLANVPVPFYFPGMPDSLPLPAPATISAAILSASAITRLGLACPSEQARQRAADDLANEIVERLKAERDQLSLAL